MNWTIPDYPAAFWLTAVIAVLLLGISKAGFAAGIGALTTPLVALTIGWLMQWPFCCPSSS